MDKFAMNVAEASFIKFRKNWEAIIEKVMKYMDDRSFMCDIT